MGSYTRLTVFMTMASSKLEITLNAFIREPTKDRKSKFHKQCMEFSCMLDSYWDDMPDHEKEFYKIQLNDAERILREHVIDGDEND